MRVKTTLVFAIPALLASSVTAAAQATFTYVEGTETPAGITSSGEMKCKGAEPTGNPFQPCPAGVAGSVRGAQVFAVEATNDPRASGTNYVVINVDINADGNAHIWGTFRMEVVDGGVWEGAWTGSVHKGVNSYTAIGHGSGGNIEGFQLLWEGIASSPTTNAVSARILNPGNSK